MSFKEKVLQRKRLVLLKDSLSIGQSAAKKIIEEDEVEASKAEEAVTDIKSPLENTNYEQYKDEYNEKEGENVRNWKGTVRSEASEKHLKARSMTELETIWKQRLPRAEIVSISAINNVGVTDLLEKIVSLLPQGPKYFTKDTLTNRDERFFAGEIVREAVFHSYKDEIPYSCEVVIEAFKDKTPQLSVIEACIVVSKDSQKAILIGKGGLKLKELGTMARGKLEKFLDRKG